MEIGIKNLYLIEILNVSLSHNYPRRFSILKVNARVGTYNVQIVFFNKHYLDDFFKKNKNVFKGIPIGIVSGRMSQEKKDAALGDFAGGKTNVLISTTVIEVGIDVKDATFMVIENADRYGLSQLHQLRGGRNHYGF